MAKGHKAFQASMASKAAAMGVRPAKAPMAKAPRAKPAFLKKAKAPMPTTMAPNTMQGGPMLPDTDNDGY
jgi:hypothetical protein